MTAPILWCICCQPAPAAVNDSRITVQSSSDVSTLREAVVRYLWGFEGFPADKLPTSVELNVPSPVGGLDGLQRVDLIRIVMEAREEVVAHHFIPAEPNHRLVIVHQGHACTLDDRSDEAGLDRGLQRTIAALLRNGYSVLGMYMPRFAPDRCVAGHSLMAGIQTLGSPLKFFLEGVAVSLNYLKTQSRRDRFPWYVEFDMTGLSGGGWTTVVYAAIDPTIQLSFPVAGSLPLYMRRMLGGDFEQVHPPFYRLAGYPDLYVMGSYGFGRRQIQVFNRYDSCCFGEAQHNWLVVGDSWEGALRKYEARVQGTLHSLGAGSFDVKIDDSATHHQISDATIADVILRELSLRRTCPPTPAACTAARNATVVVRHDTSHSRPNRLWWQWRGTTSDEIGSDAAAEYLACVYSDGVLVTDYAVQPEDDCGERTCWSSDGHASEYRNLAANSDGISRLKLERGRILLRGESARLPLPESAPMFTSGAPLCIQLMRTDGDECWQSTFPPPARENTEERFRDSIP